MANWLKRHKNGILTGLGVGLTMLSTYFACKATLKVEKLSKKAVNDIEKLPKEERKKIEKEKAKVIVKEYSKAVVTEIAGVALIFSGYNGVKKDCGKLLTTVLANTALLANYKKCAKNEIGTETEAKIEEEAINLTCRENGIDRNDYCLFFGPEYSDIASGDGFADFGTLKDIERYANRRLNALNPGETINMVDILAWLQMEAYYGGIIDDLKGYGWQKGDVIDFGLFCGENLSKVEYVTYCNGFNDTIMLNFNCRKLKK